MSIQAVAWALDQDLPARPKLVLVSIANHADHTNGYCWLRADAIAKEAACSPRAVFNFVGDLIRNGYIRKSQKKGEDGKQRANDYWIMFNRDPVEWSSERSPQAEPDSADEDTAAQDVAGPDARGAYGEIEESVGSEAVDKPPGAVGPHAPGCSRSESAEPSQSKSEKDARARPGCALVPGPPRQYRAPPSPPDPPMGMIADREAKQIFVYAGTRAYQAWATYTARKRGTHSWNLLTTRIEGGRHRSGWYFPSLFPPDDKPKAATDPPPSLMTADDVKDI